MLTYFQNTLPGFKFYIEYNYSINYSSTLVISFHFRYNLIVSQNAFCIFHFKNKLLVYSLAVPRIDLGYLETSTYKNHIIFLLAAGKVEVSSPRTQLQVKERRLKNDNNHTYTGRGAEASGEIMIKLKKK